MGLWYDIYIVSPIRNRAVVDKFLKRYVNLEHERSRTDFIINFHDTDHWLRTRTLENSVQLGLLNGDCNYTLYLEGIDPETKSSMLHYTRNGQLILGISIEAELNKKRTLKRARKLLESLKKQFNTSIGEVALETPPGNVVARFETQLAALN